MASIELSTPVNPNAFLKSLTFDENTSPKNPSNDPIVQPGAQRPPNSNITALFASKTLATSFHTVKPKQNLSSDGVPDEDEELAKEIEALLEELAKHPGEAGDLQKEIQDIKDQIKKSLKDAGASDDDINNIMAQIASLRGTQGSDRVAAIADILEHVSQLTGKSATKLANQIKAHLNDDIKDNERIEQDLALAKEIQQSLAELAEHPGGAQERQDSIKKLLKDHGVSDADINDIMAQIQSGPNADTMAKLLKQISDLTGVSEQDLTNKIANRIGFDIGNNKRAEANYADEGKYMQAAANSQDPGAKRNLDRLKNMDKLVRGVFPTREDLEKMGYTDLDRLKKNLFSDANSFRGAVADRYLATSSLLGTGGMSPKLQAGIMMAAVDSDLLALNQQIANFVQDITPLVSGISPQASQAVDELLKKFQAETAQIIVGAAQGMSEERDPKGVGNPQPQPVIDFTSNATYRQFMLRMKSATITESQTDAEILVSTRLSEDQKAANDENIQKQEDAVKQREKERNMSWIQKLFHKIASFFVDLGNMIAGAVKTVVGFLKNDSKLQASGAAQIASGIVGLIKDIAELVLDLMNNKDPKVRAKLEEVFNKVATALQDALMLVVGAIDMALGDEVQGAAMIAAGAISLAVDITNDILDAVDMDPEQRKKIEMGLGIAKDIVNLVATAMSLGGAFKAAKDVAKIGKKGLQAAGKAVANSESKLTQFAKHFDTGKNVATNLVTVAGGGVDTAATVYQGKSAKTRKEADLAKVNLDFATKSAAESVKHIEQELEALQRFLAGFIAALGASFQMAKQMPKAT